jgi:hypothetical protein
MNREEAVLLVSRALACIQGISALLEAAYLPERFMTLHHYAQRLQMAVAARDAAAFDLETYYVSGERVEIAFFFGRIAFLLLMALLFWNCGPKIARFLLPERKSPPQAS